MGLDQKVWRPFDFNYCMASIIWYAYKSKLESWSGIRSVDKMRDCRIEVTMIERTALLKAMERPTIDLGDKFNYDEKKRIWLIGLGMKLQVGNFKSRLLLPRRWWCLGSWRAETQLGNQQPLFFSLFYSHWILIFTF